MDRTTSTYNSTGRYITISRCSGWFGIYYELWARGESDDTPLWLQLYGSEETTFDFNELSGKLGLSIYDWNYFPVMLKTGLDYEQVLVDVVAQLQHIADAIKAVTPAT